MVYGKVQLPLPLGEGWGEGRQPLNDTESLTPLTRSFAPTSPYGRGNLVPVVMAGQCQLRPSPPLRGRCPRTRTEGVLGLAA